MGKPEPVEVFSLASYLAEEMDERGWTAVDVGMRMGGTTEREHSVNILTVDLMLAVSHKESCTTSPSTYRALERAFGVSDGFFERLDADWRNYPDRRVPFEAPEHLFSGGTVNHAQPNPTPEDNLE